MILTCGCNRPLVDSRRLLSRVVSEKGAQQWLVFDQLQKKLSQK